MTTRGNQEVGAAFYDHLTQYLGAPVDREVFQSNQTQPPIQILQFDNVFPKCKVFCSFGTSNYASILGVAAEVVLPCDDGWGAAGGLLANALFFLIQERMQLGRGVAVRFGAVGPEFSKQFGKAAIYFTDPFGLPSDFNFVRLGSKSGRIYLSFFISQAEYDYFCDRGAEEFEALLESADVDPYALNRESSV